MSIYAQHGWGKSTKIVSGIQNDLIDGIIWSPRDESAGELPALIQQYRSINQSISILFDPQFYVTTIESPRDGQLTNYPYYPQGLITRAVFNNPQNIERFTQDTINYQLGLGLDRLVSANMCFNDFQDQWSQIALMMANSAINYHASLDDPPPLLISLIIDEVALSSQSNLEDFLNDLSLLDTHGFYLIVRRNNPEYPTTLDSTHLENLLYLVYTLADRNQYEVVCGYSDFECFLLQAVGVKAIGCGWFSNLRQFSFARFSPSTGGQQPRPRYSSLPLLNSILISELDSIFLAGRLPEALSSSPYDSVFSSQQSPSDAIWPPNTRVLHHWHVLKHMMDSIPVGSITRRLDKCEELITQANSIYSQLLRSGATFDVTSGNRNLRRWRTGLSHFRDRLKI